MLIYNTLSGKKEPLKPRKILKLFVCGPTVYDLSHIGHARTYISFDFFVKYLRSQKLKIKYLQNITDIDDKIINRANREKISPQKLADKYLSLYLRDMKTLGVTSVDVYAKATKYIPQIIGQVKTLVKGSYVYKIPNDGWYFNVKKFPDYGKLSKRRSEEAEDAVTRIDRSIDKKNRADFCVWKFSPPAGGPREPVWKTDLGSGRPGWHIEDTAIAEKFFGPQYDLHGGGIDLKFPHHEAEIAQEESISGKKPFVKIWMHTGMLTINGKKMSKSLKNFITIKEFLKKYPPEVLRWLILSHHYRSPINFSWELAEEARNNLESIFTFLLKIDFKLKNLRKSSRDLETIKEHAFAFPASFKASLENDFNTPAAISFIFSAIEYGNKLLWRLDKKGLLKTKKFITDSLNMFGIPIKPLKIPAKINALAKKRELSRVNKQFIQADALREKIEMLGYEIEDTPLGPFIKPKA